MDSWKWCEVWEVLRPQNPTPVSWQWCSSYTHHVMKFIQSHSWTVQVTATNTKPLQITSVSRALDVAPYSATLCRDPRHAYETPRDSVSPSPTVSQPCLDSRKFNAEKASIWSWRMALINACTLSRTVEGTATKVRTIFFPSFFFFFPCRKNKTTAKQLDRVRLPCCNLLL